MVPSIAINSRERLNKGLRLRLRYQGQEVLVQDGRTTSPWGARRRTTSSQRAISFALHARVEFNRNKFMLFDRAPNGTFVLGKDGEEAFVSPRLTMQNPAVKG